MSEEGSPAAGRRTTNVRMTFHRRPTSVPPDVRPEWRVPLLLLMVHSCRGELASQEQLHVLNSAILRRGAQRTLLAALDGRLASNSQIVQFEPALSRAIDRCTGLGLLGLDSGGRLRLTDLGRGVVAAVESSETLFTTERALLAALPRPLTQTAIRTALAHRQTL